MIYANGSVVLDRETGEKMTACIPPAVAAKMMDIFKDYEDFQENFSEIYSKDYMDLVINARDQNDKEQKFFNIDGKLYINYAHAGSKGYYVDWSDYKLEIISETKSECKFRLTAVIEEPADKPVKEPYIKTFRAVYENKEWKLTAPIY
jgi:hypothetical protein